MAMPVTAVLIGILGIATLTSLTFGVRPGTRLVAALVPPWQEGGMAAVVRAGLPVLDIHWQGHVIILDTGGDLVQVKQLKEQGFWVLDASGVVACGPNEARI